MSLPTGSWIKSSRNYKIENGYLICECKNIKGKYIKNKVKIKENDSFSNINGILKLNENFKKIFITYGDNNFKESRIRICKEARRYKYFDKCFFEDRSIINDNMFKDALNNKEFKKVFNKKRGGGYWIWKPYIIYKNLLKLKKNDILVYSDAGCKFTSLNNLKKCINFAKKYKVICFKTQLSNKYSESMYTKADIFKFFNVLENKNIYNTRQYEAGILHVIKKCDFSLSVYKRWWEIVRDNPSLIDDTPSVIKNFSNFKDNRHDQSIWSLICKTMNIKEIDRKFLPVKGTRIKK